MINTFTPYSYWNFPRFIDFGLFCFINFSILRTLEWWDAVLQPGFVCFVVINSCVLPASWFWVFCFIIFPSYTPPPSRKLWSVQQPASMFQTCRSRSEPGTFARSSAASAKSPKWRYTGVGGGGGSWISNTSHLRLKAVFFLFSDPPGQASSWAYIQYTNPYDACLRGFTLVSVLDY